jgi:outer membrane protein OmpA-like peptidoglycan-associated protein
MKPAPILALGGVRAGDEMADNVARLKQLLFEPENEAIASLTRRIDAVFDRAGTADRFQASVASVLDGALRDAEVAHHAEVSAAIAPLIVKTVKTEIMNSQDELVEALYPATGRMVKAYVASAIKDLTEQINKGLAANPVMLRVNSLVSGRSVGELAIADSQKLVVQDVFLIRRSTGELLGRWPQSIDQAGHEIAGSDRDQVLSGVVAAINEFATEAFKPEGQGLRQIDLGDSNVYFRVSPTFLLVAKCSGAAPAAAEQIIDDEFHGLMDQHQTALDDETGTAPRDVSPMLRDVSGRLETRIATWYGTQEPISSGTKPLKILATLIALPLVAWIGWSTLTAYRVSEARRIATNIVGANGELQGFPTEIKVADGGRTVSVSGLTPNQTVKENLIRQLRAALVDVDVRDQLAAIPTAVAGVDMVEVKRTIDQDGTRVRKDLGEEIKGVTADLAAVRDRLAAIPVAETNAAVKALKGDVSGVAAEVAALRAKTAHDQLVASAMRHAVFFADGSAYRDPATASRTLDDLAAVIKGDTSLVRVVGYTDEAGPVASNAAISKARAETVVSALVARGVPANRLVALSRAGADHSISAQTGSRSSNRRVEFEVGFIEEVAE